MLLEGMLLVLSCKRQEFLCIYTTEAGIKKKRRAKHKHLSLDEATFGTLDRGLLRRFGVFSADRLSFRLGLFLASTCQIDQVRRTLA